MVLGISEEVTEDWMRITFGNITIRDWAVGRSKYNHNEFDSGAAQIADWPAAQIDAVPLGGRRTRSAERKEKHHRSRTA
jgi:hypothetical protein